MQDVGVERSASARHSAGGRRVDDDDLDMFVQNHDQMIQLLSITRRQEELGPVSLRGTDMNRNAVGSHPERGRSHDPDP